MQLRKRFNRMNRQALFEDASAIFIGALITSCVVDLITLMFPDNTNNQIAMTFVYAFCISNPVVYYMAVLVSPTWKYFDFTFNVAVDNTSFAWQQLVLLILSVNNSKAKAYGFSAWLIVVIVLFTLLYISNYLQYHYITMTKKARFNLQECESESYVLATVFGFTFVLASMAYGN